MMSLFRTIAFLTVCLVPLCAAEPARFEYRLLASTRTSTMEKEMNQSAAEGFIYSGVMGGETGFGGKEVVVVMMKSPAAKPGSGRQYRLLAANRTSTLQKELQEAGQQGYDYKGQTVFESTLGGKEVSVILESDPSAAGHRTDYRLLATSRTSTMQKELQEAGAEGFVMLGVSVGKSSLGGSEVICILGRTLPAK
jgi:hypothetical protein